MHSKTHTYWKKTLTLYALTQNSEMVFCWANQQWLESWLLLKMDLIHVSPKTHGWSFLVSYLTARGQIEKFYTTHLICFCLLLLSTAILDGKDANVSLNFGLLFHLCTSSFSSSGNTRSDGFGDNKKVDYHFQSPCDLSCWLYTIVGGTGLKQSLKVNVLLITPNTYFQQE